MTTDFASFLARLASFESNNSDWQSEAEALDAARTAHDEAIKTAAGAIAHRVSVLSPRIADIATSHMSLVTQTVSALDRASGATNERITSCVNTANNLFTLFNPLPQRQSDADEVPGVLESLQAGLLQKLHDTQAAVEAAQGTFSQQCITSAESYRSALETAATSIVAFKSTLANSAETIESQINQALPASTAAARGAAQATMTSTSNLVIDDIRGRAMQAILSVDTDMQHAIDEAINALSSTIDQFVSGAAGGSGPIDERARALIAAVEDILQLIPQVVQEAVAVPPRVAAKLATFGLFS